MSKNDAKNNDKCRCECKDENTNVMMDLFGILVYVNVNVINHMMLESF